MVPRGKTLRAALGQARSRERGGSEEELSFSIGRSSLCVVLVASGERGAVAILLGEEANELVADLQARFPTAHLSRAGREGEELVAQVVAFIENPARGLDLELDPRGTEFQRRVWEAVRETPRGQTITYTELAEQIGSPKAIRAVGNACSTNHLALAIPCHRVLHKDGSFSGGSFGGNGWQAELMRREIAAGF